MDSIFDWAERAVVVASAVALACAWIPADAPAVAAGCTMAVAGDPAAENDKHNGAALPVPARKLWAALQPLAEFDADAEADATGRAVRRDSWRGVDDRR